MAKAVKKETSEPSAMTPMMQQYHTVKEAHPGCLLFYRMGDFYELFFDDAKIAAKVLDIALTQRGKNGGNAIPMCGVPVHSHESYLARLIRAGHRVAVCEQTETPEQAKARGGYKALVNRDVVRIITAGTLTEDTLLEARESNFVACAAHVQGSLGLAWLDMSTGAFYTQEPDHQTITSALERIGAREIIIPEALRNAPHFFDAFEPLSSILQEQPNSLFDTKNAENRLKEIFEVGTLDSFGAFSKCEIAAAGTLLDYVARTQKGTMPRLSPLTRIAPGSVVDIDAATRKNLEITRTLLGTRKGSLLDCIDHTITAAGARLLSERLSAPSRDLPTIQTRHAQVACFTEAQSFQEKIREDLRALPDIQRALSRLSLNRGGPRDLAMIRDGMKAATSIRTILITDLGDTPALTDILQNLKSNAALDALHDTLKNALSTELPVYTRDGGFIAWGYLGTLDEIKSLRDDSKKLIARLQAEYASQTGVNTLKVTHNNVLGYFIEVPAKQADKLMVHGQPANDDSSNPFVHRQTLANVVRFSTPKLSELESKIVNAADRAKALEIEAFEKLRTNVLENAHILSVMADALAELDVATALAHLAVHHNYVHPKMDDSDAFHITDGRHPVVEAALKKESSATFVPNDCDLSNSSRLWLLTGPNMAGKSTYLRQNALITILAQAGSFVPAHAAHIGLVDRIFSRVGASDDLARGRSTFMVEMVETAAILNQATPKSLVILDEIGRGTATFDGLSIAWATLEYLHDKSQCRALFATHYHELTTLTQRLSTLSCHSMKVKEWKGDIVFMHEVVDGAADHSYGVHVAKLAGLPDVVIIRAKQILAELEQSKASGALATLVDTLPLFQSIITEKKDTIPTIPPALQSFLDTLDPDGMSPKDALDALYHLKKIIK